MQNQKKTFFLLKKINFQKYFQGNPFKLDLDSFKYITNTSDD